MTADNGESDEREDLQPEMGDEPSTEGFSAQSILRGLRDTASHMLAEARAEARRAKDEAWERYEQKTKHRRDKD